VTRAGVVATLLFATTVLGLAGHNVRPRGDGFEYVLMAAAFAIHATPDVRAADTAWVAASEPRLGGVMRQVQRGMASHETSILGSIQQAPSGRYYSFHFWFYSLLAAPFLWAVQAVGLTPLLALPLINATAVLAASFYALRVLPGRARFWLPIAFLLSGTTYYLHWSGPEALTASAALVSALAAMLGRPGHAILAAGLASTQNPGAVSLVVLIVGWWFLLRRDPTNALFASEPLRRFDRGSVACALGGGLLALLSPLFFLLTFGEPSLIAKQTIDLTLATPPRLFSLLFDLNQGLIVGIPGLVLGFGIAAGVVFHLRSVSEKRLLYASLALGAMTSLFAALPSLGTVNWNSGCSVFMRYAYWTSMPLLVSVLGVTARLSDGVRLSVAGPAALVQALSLGVYGVSGTSAAYTRPGPAARFVMTHFPAFYNPEPEIFFERSLGREAPPTAYAAVAWPDKKHPTKILVTRPGPITWPELCGGDEFDAASIARTARDTRYLNGPFQCRGKR
jgi:hypothetical protein